MSDPRASEPWPTDPGPRPPTAWGGTPPGPGGAPLGPGAPPAGPPHPGAAPPGSPAPGAGWPSPGASPGWSAPGSPPPGTGWPAAPSAAPRPADGLPSWARSAPPAPPTPPPGRGRGVVLVVALAVVVALLSASVTWLVVRDDGDEDVAAPATSTTTATSEPPASSTPPSSAPATPPASIDPAELEAAVLELQEFVANERGRPFQRDVTVEVVADAEFEERLLADLEESREDIELQQRLLAALGLVDGGIDLYEAHRQLLGEGVLGFYDPETDELVVRGTELTPFVRETIVHELVHAHDDQWFELHRPQYDDLEDETGFGFAAVVEGNARRVEQAWTATLSDEERRERDAEEARFGLDADFSAIPLILLEMLVAPYELGAPFVADLVERGGESAVEEVITTPPTTSEQVILPEKLAAGEGAVAVADPPANGEVIDQGVFGMLLVQLLVGQSVSPSEAFEAAEGWAGDRYVAWDTPDGATCVRIDVQVDTPGDVLELLAAMDAFSADSPNVTAAQIDPLTVRVDGCTDSTATGGSPA